MSPNIDIFTLGGVILFMLNNGKTWRSSDDLQADSVDQLVIEEYNFFEPQIYNRIKAFVKRCFMSADENLGDAGFLGFHEMLKSLEQEFGYFIKKVESIHTQKQRPDPSPTNDSPITAFRNYMRAFYNDFYFGRIAEAFKNFGYARRLMTQLGQDNDTLLDSFKFNDLMIKWIKGKVSASHVIKNSQKWLSIQLLSHTNNYHNLHQAIKLLRTVHDSKFITFFDTTFGNLAEHYVYKDYNTKHVMINSNDKCSVSNVLISTESNTMVISTYNTGVGVYTLDRELKSSYSLQGITALAGGDDLGVIILGTNHGIVYSFDIAKGTAKIEEKSVKQLYRHEGKVSMAAMSVQGNLAATFGSLIVI